MVGVADESLLSGVESREDLLKAKDVKVPEMLDEFGQAIFFVIREVGLNQRRPHEHVV